MLIIIVLPFYLKADDFVHQTTVDAAISYDYLTPADIYDDWKSFEIRYTNRFNPTTTLTTAGGLSSRDTQFGWFQAGIYKDWLPRFYTYSGVTTATPTSWMGKWRFDNEFYTKLGPDKQYIFVLGQTAILYRDDREDYILSVGSIWYKTHFIADARYFFNWSDPGRVESNSVRISLGLGTIGKSWTTLTAGLGSQAYLGLGNQLEVNQKINSILLTEQVWLDQNWGLKLGAGYLKIEDGYEKYHASIGYFHQLP